MFAASSVSWNYAYLLSWGEIFFKERKRFPVRHCADGAVDFVTDYAVLKSKPLMPDKTTDERMANM